MIVSPLRIAGQQNAQSPVIEWELPDAASSRSDNSTLLVRAKIFSDFELQSVQVLVNKQPVQADNSEIKTGDDRKHYLLEKKVEIMNGRNTIMIMAANSKGVTYSGPRQVTLFLGSAPVIKVISPAEDDLLNVEGTAKIKAEITSQTELQVCRLNHNGKILSDVTGQKPVKTDADKYVYEKEITLQYGDNRFFIEAKNILGTGTSEIRKIIYQREPTITWITPAQVNNVSNEENFRIRAEIKTPYELQSSFININGTALQDNKEGLTKLDNLTYIFEKTIPLSPGKNSINIVATNSKGIANSSTFYVSYQLPVIRLINPSEAESVSFSGSFLLKAEVESKNTLERVRVFLNGTPANANFSKSQAPDKPSSYQVETPITLVPGLNTVYVEAKNSLGISGTEKVHISWRLEPFIIWISPSSPDINSSSETAVIKASIKTKFDLQNVRINLNDSILPDDNKNISRLDNETYMFERSINLRPGENIIALDAGNAKGIGYSAKMDIFYKPGMVDEIKWITPGTQLTNSSLPELPLSASVRAKGEIKEIHLYVDGEEINSGNKEKITRKTDKEWIYEFILPLKKGKSEIEFKALTSDGTVTSGKRTINYSPAMLPVLSWKNPATGIRQVSQPSFTVSMNIKAEKNPDKIDIYLNGKPLNIPDLSEKIRKEGDVFIIESPVSLTPGENEIYFTAANDAGTARSESSKITYTVPSTPVITWTDPVTGNTGTSGSAYRIKAVISSTADLNNIKLILNNSEVAGISTGVLARSQGGDYLLEKIIELAPGENTISIMAGNLAGNATSETRSISYSLPAAPVLTWISPSRVNNDINQYNARIKARISSAEKLQSLMVYVNGSAVDGLNDITAGDNKSETIIEKGISLNPGENNIYIIASNSNGTAKSEIRYLTNPPTNPPLIRWSVPSDPRAVVNSEVVTIEACITSSTDLKSAQIFVNGVQQASEMMFQPPQAGDCNYRLTKPVILKEGDNSVIVIATNFAGSQNSDPRIIKYQTSMIAEKRLALVYGNSNYGNSGSLSNPVNDANLMEATLKELGFEVIKRLNATKNEMMESLREFSKKLPEYNVALFYYAGHGIQVDGQNYLIPIDALLKEKTDCKWEALPVNYIVEEFERVPDNINIVILDACRNNPFRSWVRGGEQGFRAISPVSGTIVSFATSEGSTAADGSGKNGTYTEELVRQIVIPQPISSVFINTRKEVMKRTNNAQRPQEWNMLTGEFYFRK